MPDSDAIAAQLEFFARNQSGCAFAAVAARDPNRYEWAHRVLPFAEVGRLDDTIANAMDDPVVSTLSVIFPDVTTDQQLDNLIARLAGHNVFLHETFDTELNRCFRFRAKIGSEQSYISGFGPFAHLPVTRQTPFTALLLRVKPRPAYSWHLKEPDPGLIHVADMDMKGISDRNLRRLWSNSFLTVRGLLGKKPDQESAAKTTFTVPLNRAQNIAL